MVYSSGAMEIGVEASASRLDRDHLHRCGHVGAAALISAEVFKQRVAFGIAVVFWEACNRIIIGG